MLIVTNRHTSTDLELWRELEEIDMLRWSEIKSSKIEMAIDEIREASKNKSYISVSWGKDSVATAHLCHMAGVILPMIWIKETPMYNPYCETVRDLFLEQYDFPYHEFVVDYGNIGFGPFLDKNMDSILFHSIAKAIGNSFGRRITGIRNQESNKRLLRYLNYGHTTSKTCAPISLWKTWEVFAYLKKYDLPVHPNYAMSAGGRYKRDHIRVDCIAGAQGNGMGRLEWEHEYYLDILNRANNRKSRGK